MLFVTLIALISCTVKSNPDYSVPEIPWNEQLGNHRAVLQVDHPATAVSIELLWRRHDKSPDEREFIIIHENGDTIQNIHRIQVNNERCHLVFGPVKRGLYFFYYLPFEVQKGYGSYSKNYLPKEEPPDPDWVNALPANVEALSKATCVEIQARTPFDSFFPMEVIATDEEKENYTDINREDYFLFAEDRKFPVRMKDNIPSRWLAFEQPASLSGKAMRNEYYAFQIAVWATEKDIDNVEFEFESLKSNDSVIPADAFTCFNTDGVDPHGRIFRKRVGVRKGQVQSFWIGLDILKDVVPGSYRGYLKVKTANAGSRQVQFDIHIDNEVLPDRGDRETWRHSRLRWLNSTAGIDDLPVVPYDAIRKSNDGVIELSGKRLEFDRSGLPKSIEVYGNEILHRPITFIIESTNRKAEALSKTSNFERLKEKPGVVSSSWTDHVEGFEVQCQRTIEFDGWLDAKIKVKATKDITVNDMRLEIPFRTEMSIYMMGMGQPGQSTPTNHVAKWTGPCDSFWIGNVNGGLHCELRGADYTGPLLNLYKPSPPASWYNDGKGGFKIRTRQAETRAVVYSGKRDLKAGEEVEFEFALIITPVKKLDPKSQFVDRYFQRYPDPMPSKEDMEAKIKIINVHHANKYNPHINYPFIAVDALKAFVERWHEQGIKVKVYYTIRELTNYATEVWALRSLGDEIFRDGSGGGYPWLREHFRSGYYPQWYDRIDSVTADASVLTAAGESRWYNYYVEGLKWLVKNVDIDGLYLDDVAFDRNMLKRMKKVMNEVKPGCIFDLHSNTGFSKGPVLQYMEYFPYLDKLWFGESFDYNQMTPENYLIEVSGIPFGLMGDMLHAGGNPWRGMVYGMTVRYPWMTEGVICDPRAIWKVLDTFGIAGAKMVGYWEDQPVISTDNQNVKATAYLKDGKMLISIASWADKPVNVKLNINWKATGLDPSNVVITAPDIEKFQPERSFSVDGVIPVEPTKGWLLLAESTSEKK